jgi:hypothetical protein
VAFLDPRENYELTPNQHIALRVSHIDLTVLVSKFRSNAVKNLSLVQNLKQSISHSFTHFFPTLHSLSNLSLPKEIADTASEFLGPGIFVSVFHVPFEVLLFTTSSFSLFLMV